MSINPNTLTNTRIPNTILPIGNVTVVELMKILSTYNQIIL